MVLDVALVGQDKFLLNNISPVILLKRRKNAGEYLRKQ